MRSLAVQYVGRVVSAITLPLYKQVTRRRQNNLRLSISVCDTCGSFCVSLHFINATFIRLPPNATAFHASLIWHIECSSYSNFITNATLFIICLTAVPSMILTVCYGNTLSQCSWESHLGENPFCASILGTHFSRVCLILWMIGDMNNEMLPEQFTRKKLSWWP